MIRRVVCMLAGIVVFAVGCSFTKDGPVERISGNDVLYGLNDTIPTTTTSTTTTTTIPQVPTSSIAPTTTLIVTESIELYFVAGTQLTFVVVPVPSPVTLPQVVARLQQGPPRGGLGVGLRSAIPPNVTIDVRDDGSGIATVDLDPTFFDTIPQTDQLFAVGQLVLTLRQEGIGQVRFTQSGVPIRVPTGSGALAEPGQALALTDYQVLLDSVAATTVPTTLAAPTTVSDGVTTTTVGQ